ncbi:hypothetical protein [Psychrobacter sp. AT9]|uniref:hypothetical protein n=1 Tax=Psychrobacter sp. AT9 TaxID=3242893 RepID=UPI0039A6EF24
MLNTPYRQGISIPLMIAAATIITEGELVAVDSAGEAVPATDADAKYLMGRSETTASPQTPAINNTIVVTRNRQFLLANDATNPVTQADIGSIVVLTGKNMVGKFTDGDPAILGVGALMGVDYNGQVWVEVGSAPIGKIGTSIDAPPRTGDDTGGGTT